MASLAIGNYEKVRALAANARLLLVGGARASSTSRLTAYEPSTNKVAWSVELPAAVLGLALAGESWVAACADGTLRIGALGDGAVQREVEAHQGACTAVALNPDGTRAFTVGVDGYLRAFELAKGKRVHEWLASPQPLRAVAVDPSGTSAACAGDDSVVRSFTLATGARRDMPGHEGAVRALSFTPRDGRLVSAGDDGKLRIWYLVGAVEHEVRGDKDSGHAGAVLALLFPPTPTPERGEEAADRIFSSGTDGKVKAWRLDERRKPRTLDCGSKPVHALVFSPPLSARQAKVQLGFVFVGGDDRTVRRFELDTEGKPSTDPMPYAHGFDLLDEARRGNRPKREAAVREAALLEEPEALDFVLSVLSSDKEHEVRKLAAEELGKQGRTGARAKLRERLDDENVLVRVSALWALTALEKESPLAAPRAALDSRYPDTRMAGLRALASLGGTSPLVPGLISSKLTDSDATVGTTALDALVQVSPKGSTEPLKTAFERGTPALRVEVLIRAAGAGWLGSPQLQPLVARALDDADADVRRVAFTVRVLERRPLAHVLEEKDADFARASLDVARRLTRRPRPTDDEARAARDSLPSTGKAGAALTEPDLEPLLAAMACRTPDTAVRGARGLAQLGDARALGALLQLSREPEAAIRRQAAEALRALQDARARERLVWMLDDENADVRATALDAVVSLDAGEAPLSSAEAALRSSHEDMRVRGLDRLVKLSGKRSEAAVHLLGDALEDESPKVRDEAFRTLWAWNEKSPQEAIDRALSGRFPDLRRRAVDELAARLKEDWAVERLKKTVGDRDASVAQAAYEAWVKHVGKEKAEPHLAAMDTAHASLRALAAKGATQTPAEAVRSPLLKLLLAEEPLVYLAAIEALDKLIKTENGPLLAGLGSGELPLKVRAAELLAARGAEDIIEPMRNLLTDKELQRIYPPAFLAPLRHRAANALATLGSRRLLSFYTSLLKDEASEVREQAARGLATASRRGDEGALLDALGHSDVAVRSWAADGLSRLGDIRALPVLTGNLRHEHQPIRIGAILSFAALGPDGDSGLLHGLEDRAREVQEVVFSIILARDSRASRRGEPPDLLTSALSSGRPEVRYAAARALELRTETDASRAHLVEVLQPTRPEKAGDMKDWPAEDERARTMAGLAEALASDVPEQRYAAAQVLLLRHKPLDYFREAAKVARPRSLEAPWKPETSPVAQARPVEEKPARNWLRRLFSSATGKAASAEPSPEALVSAEKQHLRRLAFGAYVGLLRQVSAGDDEGHRVRRDAVDRVVKLTQEGHAGTPAAVAALLRALEDPHQLVRKAALAGLKELYPAGSDEPLALALASLSADVARAALEELAARGESAKGRITAALNSPLADVRKYAFELLERLSPPGSLEPLLAALGSEHADLRVGVIERLAGANDSRVTEALGRAMGSEHEDLRLRAAELLAMRQDDRAVEVLAAFLRSENAAAVKRAQEALARIDSVAAVGALAARLRTATEVTERLALVRALGRIRKPEALDALARQLDDEAHPVRLACVSAAMDVATPHEKDEKGERKRDAALAVRFLRVAVRNPDPMVRKAAATELEPGDNVGQDELLAGLFTDRDVTVRMESVARYASRVLHKGAKVEPLEEVLRGGARELMLPAAEGVASRGLTSALRPLLLYVRAGEEGDRERALLALGTLGDARALPELEGVAAGGTPEAPVEPSMVAAAIEGLGRLAAKLPESEDRRRAEDKVELSALEGKEDAIQQAAIRGLRHLGGERARSRLETLLRDDGGTGNPVRITAAEELGKLGDVAAEGTLALALDDYDDELRTAARKALDALFPKERVRVELLAVNSEHEDISEPAASYLATEADPMQLLPRLATLESEDLRQRLRRGLVRRTSLPAGALALLLGHEKPSAREESAWLVGARTGEQDKARTWSEDDRAALGRAIVTAERRTATEWGSTPSSKRAPLATAWERLLWAGSRLEVAELMKAARSALQGGDDKAPAGVRLEAARALDRLNAAPEALRAALSDPDAGVREAAATALARLAPERAAEWALAVQPFDPVATAPTGAAVRTPKQLATSEARRLALPSLLADKELEPLRPLATHKDEAVRQDAWAALGRLGGDSAAEVLRAQAFDKNQSVELRKAAYRAHKRALRAAQRARKEGSPS
ncbi:HEAT repeat domain-containing protein [Archangium sp.]|uniref:HEAT repeat domain-containing protein n=1 Tax=Archangium sp. TaxID=1872627 RepID=UPI00286CE2FB|nr:HEAT repeat domain-containing protein [Archangium sp.]